MADRFKVGQKVTVQGPFGAVLIAITTVAAIGARKMKLADGSEWTADGCYQWGCEKRHYMGPCVREFRDEDTDALFRRRAIDKLSKTRWADLSSDVLRQILNRLTVGTEEAPPRSRPSEG